MTMLNNELIELDMANLDRAVSSVEMSQEINELAMKAMSEEETVEVQKVWQERTGDREILQDGCSTKEVNEKAK